MRYPPRLAHLATRAVVTAKLMPTYAAAFELDDDDAAIRVSRALEPRLLDDVLAAGWSALQAASPELGEEALLDKVARSLKNRPQRPGKVAEVTAAWSAFLVLMDVHAGIATDSARQLLETEQGGKRAAEGMAAAGRLLAAEFSRK